MDTLVTIDTKVITAGNFLTVLSSESMHVLTIADSGDPIDPTDSIRSVVLLDTLYDIKYGAVYGDARIITLTGALGEVFEIGYSRHLGTFKVTKNTFPPAGLGLLTFRVVRENLNRRPVQVA